VDIALFVIGRYQISLVMWRCQSASRCHPISNI